MIYIALDSPERSARRVARRVRAGGHDVPADRLARRWRDSLANLPRFAALAAAFWVFDNSDEHPDTPPLLVCRGRAGRIEGEVRDAFSALAEAVAALR